MASAQLPIPPTALLERVQGRVSGDPVEAFLGIGRQCGESVVATLARAGKQLTDFRTILDFGVGCGRTLRVLAPLAPRARFYGTDIDPQAIHWCQANLGFASFTTNAPLPPLPFDNGRFDLIYAISVFTHLNESYQFQWLAELRRVARPGALVIVTLHGDSLFQNIPPDMRPLADSNGFAFVDTEAWRGIFPDWYQNAFHSARYVSRWYPRFFRVLAHLPQGMAGHQDAVLLQRE